MSSDEHRPSDGRRTGPAGAFGALLAAAAREPGAARGLALAYAALGPPERKSLVQAVVADAQQEGICASLVLASLLAVEDDSEVAQCIADALAALENAEIHGERRTRAYLAGDENSGGVLVVRPLHGTFVEALGLAWEHATGITRTFFEPLTHFADAQRLLRELPSGLKFEEMPLGFAIDTVAGPLWNHRRMHGQLPPEVERFADLFSCTG